MVTNGTPLALSKQISSDISITFLYVWDPASKLKIKPELGLVHSSGAQAVHFCHHPQKGEDHPALATFSLQPQAVLGQKALMDCNNNNIEQALKKNSKPNLDC